MDELKPVDNITVEMEIGGKEHISQSTLDSKR